MVPALGHESVVAVIGAGAMGTGIAQVATQAGHPVRLFDTRSGAAARAVSDIRVSLAKLAAKGKIDATAAGAAGDRLSVADSTSDLADASLVVEAIVERLDVKTELFLEIERIVRDDCILASNTSSISITSIAAGLRRPQRVVGLHFFNPAPLMALVEVVSGLSTDPVVAEAAYQTAKAWGKTPVHARSTPGFIVNRVARPFYAEGLRLLSEGAADVETIDAVMREAGGFRMGPFELMDLIGNDVNYAVTCSVFDAYYGDPRFAPSVIQQELVNAGHLGRKSGRGFYDYSLGAKGASQSSEPPAALVGRVTVWTSNALGAALASRLRHAGVQVDERRVAHSDGRTATVDHTVMALTDGRSATQRAADMQHEALVLHDVVLDPVKSGRIAIAVADRCSPSGRQAATAMLQAAGFVVSRLDDVPGMAVMRTVAMLANEAMEVVHHQVCDAVSADLAMCKGVNYPRGPLAWADEIGPRHVLRVLDHLALAYGEDRYRASALMRRRVAGRQPLLG
ncbi:MAG: 3-hydroxyacyl-CoA dehydrogenase [Pseudomonadota bacterium]